MLTRCRVARAFAWTLLFVGVANSASTALLSAGQKNLQAVTEAAILSHSMPAEALGFPAAGEIDALFARGANNPRGMGRTLCVESAGRSA